jgi:hypothetical protein
MALVTPNPDKNPNVTRLKHSQKEEHGYKSISDGNGKLLARAMCKYQRGMTEQVHNSLTK